MSLNTEYTPKAQVFNKTTTPTLTQAVQTQGRKWSLIPKSFNLLKIIGVVSAFVCSIAYLKHALYATQMKNLCLKEMPSYFQDRDYINEYCNNLPKHKDELVFSLDIKKLSKKQLNDSASYDLRFNRCKYTGLSFQCRKTFTGGLTEKECDKVIEIGLKDLAKASVKVPTCVEVLASQSQQSTQNVDSSKELPRSALL